MGLRRAEGEPRRPGRPGRRLRLARRWIVYHLLIAPALIALRFLPAPMTRLALRVLGLPIFHLTTKGRSLRHLRMVYGAEKSEAELRELAREVSRHFGKSMTELAELMRHGPARFRAKIDDARARAITTRLRERPRPGFIGLTAHIGNWELLGHWLAQSGIVEEVAAVATQHSNPWLDRRLVAFRKSLGLETFRRQESTAALARYLRDGHAIALLADQDMKNVSGAFIDFLGHRAYTATGPARLALAAGVPIVCAALLRKPDGSFDLLVSEPIEPDRQAPRAAEIERMTRAWSAEVERWIRTTPEQWTWFHERWRTTPEKLAARGRAETGAGDTDAGQRRSASS